MTGNDERGPIHDVLHNIKQEEDRLFRITKSLIGLIIGLTVLAAGGTFAVFYARRDAAFRVFISIILGWSGYLFAHYAATGKFIHQKAEQRVVPRDAMKVIGAGYGTVLLAAGVTVWAIALGQGDILTATLGGLTAMLGYIIAHYELTGILL